MTVLALAVQPGEMARRVHDLDWSRTALGASETWSLSLKMSVAIILTSGFPMAIRWGPELVLIYNDAYRPILGDKHPGALGRPLREVWREIYPDLGPLSEAVLRGERGAFFAEDHPWTVRRQGSVVEEARFTISYSPIPDETAPNGIGGILTTCIETTERVRKEAALQVLNDRLEAEIAQRVRERDRIWQVSEDLLGVSNFEGYFTSVNPAWTSLLGWSEDEIKRMHVSELRHPDDLPHSMEGRRRLAEGVPTVRMENRFRHKDGSWLWIYWTMTAEQRSIYVIGRHVTAEKLAAEALRESEQKLRRAQEQLAESQKMEALGQLTGGIAHDFNNMLMVVSGNAQILKRRLREPKNLRAAEAIELAAARGENLTRQLLAFSRRQTLNPTVISLRRRLTAFRELLASSVRGDIKLAIDIRRNIWPVLVDLHELELALVNLAVNARDAMPDGGNIAITASNVSLQPEDTPERLKGEFVGLIVSDTGCGIAPEILPKVFEPFFTTKQLEKGTGLGLSQVYGLARQSGGTATISSEPGKGTTVTIYLPRSHRPLSDPLVNVEPLPSGRETILLVEDNPDVEEIAGILLEQLGYQVRHAQSAHAALKLLASGEAIDLVFTDIVMPGELDGVALARRITEEYPDLAVLLTTGYARAVNTIQAGFPVLRKPYQLPALARAVRDALDTQSATLLT